MMRRNFYSSSLKLKQLFSKIVWNAEFRKTRTGLLSKMISHFYIYVIRRNQIHPRPALFNNACQLLRYVKTPFVIPSAFKPFCQFLTGIVVKDINIQFALL